MSMEHNNQNQLPRHHRRNWNTVPENVYEEKLYLINIIDIIGVRGCQHTINLFSFRSTCKLANLLSVVPIMCC